MKMNMPRRKPNRLKRYDYGQTGCYFVTVCTHDRAQLFALETSSDAGSAPQNRAIHARIAEIPDKFGGVTVEKYVIMPDHVHMIVTISGMSAANVLPEIMRFFKTATTNDYIRAVRAGQAPPFDGRLWQRSYYDHVIRGREDHDEIWEYIENNPAKWLETHVCES